MENKYKLIYLGILSIVSLLLISTENRLYVALGVIVLIVSIFKWFKFFEKEYPTKEITIEPNHNEIFSDKIIDEPIEKEIYGYISLTNNRVYLKNQDRPLHDSYRVVTKGEVDSEGILTLTNHIESIMNEQSSVK